MKEPYRRLRLFNGLGVEVMVSLWRGPAVTAQHDHGGGSGGLMVLFGRFVEHGFDRKRPPRALGPGDVVRVGRTDVHALQSLGSGAALHVYRGCSRGLRVFDPLRREMVQLPDGQGAWL